MQVDFYQLTRDPAEQVIPAIAQKIVGDGGRLLVIVGDEVQAGHLSEALWALKPETFLAHGFAGSEGDANQPILLSLDTDPSNGARMVAIADGEWRDAALQFDRAFYLFPPGKTDNARAAWRAMAGNADVECRYWKQDGGKWRQGP